MLPKSVDPVQLDLFISDSAAYREAVARYEEIRPVLKGERTLPQQSEETGINYWRLWRDLRRFGQSGILGLIDRRKLSHPRGKIPIEQLLPEEIQQHVVRLAMAHPFTYRELAKVVQDCYHYSVDYRGIQRLLKLHHLPPEELRSHHQKAEQVVLPPLTPSQQIELLVEPSSKAQRLQRALGPEHLLIRFRTYREYPTEEQARWRIIELLDVGFRPRRVAHLLSIRADVVYHWRRRFKDSGLLGLSTRARVRTPIATRVSVEAMTKVFELIDNNPLLGHYRVKMALDSFGYQYGHSTVWQMVAFYKQAHANPKRGRRRRKPEERPKQAIQAHQVWFMDLRYLVKIEGKWLYSILILGLLQ